MPDIRPGGYGASIEARGLSRARRLRGAICLAIVALLTLPTLTSVWETEHGTVLITTERDAFVVVSMTSYGWRGSPMRLAMILARGAIGGAAEFSQQRSRVVLARLQPGGVQRQVVEGRSGRVGFVDGKLVVVNAGLRWAGDRFVRLTDAEKTDAIERVSTTNESGGVFRRGLLSAFETDVTFSLNGDAYRLRAKPKGRFNSLTVSRNGGPVETVVSVDGRVRFVSRATYEELFGLTPDP
jgi:hypothetical protein